MKENTPKTILLVDDDEEFLLYVRTTLESGGHDVVTAATTAQALAQIAKSRFAMVLADLRLPEGSGLDVLHAAREADPLAVGIVLTGHSSVDSALEALREGAYDYLVKPCAPDALLAAVRRGIEHYQLKLALVHKTAELERLETQLHDKSKMIQNVSHELKNPLSVVYGYSSFLLKQDPEETKPEDLRRSLQSIHNNAERLGHLLEELIESSRLSSHKVELERALVSASTLCRDAAENFKLEASRRKIDLRAECPMRDALVNADARRAHQILANLMTNALKFTPEGGAITVSAKIEEGFVRFCVKDSGVGIVPEDMPHLFDRFYQAESTRKSHTGLGLGLDISRGLVELHGGRIWAESIPGRGSSFYFTLPISLPKHTRPPQERARTQK